MPEAQFDVERATGGLVMALFVASALLLAALTYFVFQDLDRRTEVADDSTSQAVRVGSPLPLASAADPLPPTHP